MSPKEKMGLITLAVICTTVIVMCAFASWAWVATH